MSFQDKCFPMLESLKSPRCELPQGWLCVPGSLRSYLFFCGVGGGVSSCSGRLNVVMDQHLHSGVGGVHLSYPQQASVFLSINGGQNSTSIIKLCL